MRISGTQLAQKIYQDIQEKISKLKMDKIIPKLMIIKSSNIDAVNNYVRQKVEKGKEIGVEVELLTTDNALLNNQGKITELISQLNSSKTVHGIIFQKPGDKRINEEIEKFIDPLKDVDGFLSNSYHEPPTYRGIKLVLNEIFKESILETLRNKQFVVIGKGKTGGTPIINGLLRDKVSGANIKIIDSRTSETDKKLFIKNADIVISAVGKPNPVNSRFFSKKTILIDIGVHFNEENKIKGDFNEEKIKERVSYYTTTPGGIGALTVAFLMDNVVNASLAINKITIEE